MTSISPSPSSSPSSTPPLQLPPPPVANSPPPSPDTSAPPPSPDTSAPPPESPAFTPQSPPAAPPLAPPATTVAPPSPSPSPSPPPPITATPPKPPILSPPPSGGSPPPDTTASPPPPPREIIPSPPASASPPPISTSPPPSNSSNPNLHSPPGKPTSRATDTTTTGKQNDTSNGSPNGSKTVTLVAIGVVIGFITLSLLLMAIWFKRKQKRRKNPPYANYIMPSPSPSSQNSDSQILMTQSSTHQLAGNPSLTSSMYSPDHGGADPRSCFTYKELTEATNGFSGSNLLGEGGFGCVYKGLLADGREVAIKQLKIGGEQGEREFRAEVEIIGRVHHRHLVSLVGYCIYEHQRLLVYQYVPNNTLHYHLHGEGAPVMNWVTRIRVAAGAARGLAYLHEDCHPRIIHRDIKSSNILLDDNFDAHVADFGLAKLAMDSNTHVTTRVMGTFGYMAPEYASSGKLTEKSDVFSFGVVLLELITGRKPVDASQPVGDESLVQWARPLVNRALENQDFEDLVDPMLGKNYVQIEMLRMIEAAAACIRHLAPKRPRMSQVVTALDLIVECTTDLSNGMKPGESEIVDSRQQSAHVRLFQRMVFGGQDYSSEFLDDSQISWRS